MKKQNGNQGHMGTLSGVAIATTEMLCVYFMALMSGFLDLQVSRKQLGGHLHWVELNTRPSFEIRCNWQ
jgi:hypothetical protein